MIGLANKVHCSRVMPQLKRFLIAGLIILVLAGCEAGEKSPVIDAGPIDQSTSVSTVPTASDPALGDSRVRLVDGMAAVYVPGGEFVMGSDEDEV